MVGEAIEVLRSIWDGNTGRNKGRYLVSGILWQLRKRLGHTFIKRVHTGGFVSVQPSSSYAPIFYFEWPEGEDQLFIRRCRGLAPTFVDIGANVGLFSLLMIDCFESFYLFEPSPSTFKALADTCSLNPNICWHLFNVGVADEKGSMAFLDEGTLSSVNRFCDENYPVSQNMQKIPVKVDLLDNLIPRNIGDIILKVDVEGFEERVFKGAKRIFSERQARLVMFERLGRTNLQNLKNFFRLHGYTVFAVQKDGKITTDEAVVSMPLINLFATPDELFSSLA